MFLFFEVMAILLVESVTTSTLYYDIMAFPHF